MPNKTLAFVTYKTLGFIDTKTEVSLGRQLIFLSSQFFFVFLQTENEHGETHTIID